MCRSFFLRSKTSSGSPGFKRDRLKSKFSLHATPRHGACLTSSVFPSSVKPFAQSHYVGASPSANNKSSGASNGAGEVALLAASATPSATTTTAASAAAPVPTTVATSAGLTPPAPPPPWEGRAIATHKLRLVEFSAFLEQQRDPDTVTWLSGLNFLHRTFISSPVTLLAL